jgi:Mn-containing catalase
MPINNPKEVFVQLLSNVREGTLRETEFFKELSQTVQEPEIKEALEMRVFITDTVITRLDQCFKLIGEKPVKLNSRVAEVCIEDFRKEIAMIQNPVAKHLFVLSALNQLVHFRIAEYVTLISAADMTGHFGVGVLLETCLADKMAFVERTRRLVRSLIETKLAAKVAA